MAIHPDGPAPYAPAQTVISLIEGYRDRGLGQPFDANNLMRAGVTESLAPRTLQSLRLLDLIDEGGIPTDQFEALRRARGEEEYKARLQEWLRGVYSDVLQFADPSRDPAERVYEAFRGYKPPGQRSRMVTLMLGLFEHAGLIERMPKRKASAPSDIRPQKAPARRKTRLSDVPTVAMRAAQAEAPDLPPGLVGLLKQIPRGGESWTKERRENFLKAFTAVLDFSVPIEEFDSWVLGDEDEEAGP